MTHNCKTMKLSHQELLSNHLPSQGKGWTYIVFRKGQPYIVFRKNVADNDVSSNAHWFRQKP
jgi:hypothetical protein